MDPARTHALMRHYGMLFDTYHGKAPWFFLLELSVTIAASVGPRLKHVIGCDAIAWTLARSTRRQRAVRRQCVPHAVRWTTALTRRWRWRRRGGGVRGCGACACGIARRRRGRRHGKRARRRPCFSPAWGRRLALVACTSWRRLPTSRCSSGGGGGGATIWRSTRRRTRTTTTSWTRCCSSCQGTARTRRRRRRLPRI